MRILLISSAFSGLTQRFYTELDDAGYDVSVELHQGDVKQLLKGVALFKPDLIICPFLTQKVPKKLYENYTCLIVHPGIKGDRGPSSLDWAIQTKQSIWGVTLLQAREEMDAGEIWASKTFPMRATTKSSLFNREVTQAAIDCLWDALTFFNAPAFKPEPLDYSKADVKGKLQPFITQKDRAIDWQKHTTKEILRRIHAADGSPGLLDEINGEAVYLYNAHKAENLAGNPGDIIAIANHAICRATVNGAVWVGHLKLKTENAIKLPASYIISERLQKLIKHIEIDYTHPRQQLPCQEVWFEQEGDVAYIYSNFHNGGMSTEQCQLLLKVYRHVVTLPVKAIVLMGGEDAWSNGIHLNHIENAEDPALESWLNINAIDDLVHQIITTVDKLTISAVAGNAGAGGAMMALAADKVLAREGVVFNPHYKNMGGLYGSEYWTYLLPKRVGSEVAEQLTEQLLPISAKKALRLGFVDHILDKDHVIFKAQVKQLANMLIADSQTIQNQFFEKAATRKMNEIAKPLAVYRQSELTQMYANFYANNDYHEARHQFIYKESKKGTPANIAKHRQPGRIFSLLFHKRASNKKPVIANKNTRSAKHSLGV